MHSVPSEAQGVPPYKRSSSVSRTLLQFNHSVDMLSDAQRIQRVKLLADNGYTDRLVIAHDIHLKHRLVGTNIVYLL